jgi:hypothetical protein
MQQTTTNEEILDSRGLAELQYVPLGDLRTVLLSESPYRRTPKNIASQTIYGTISNAATAPEFVLKGAFANRRRRFKSMCTIRARVVQPVRVGAA